MDYASSTLFSLCALVGTITGPVLVFEIVVPAIVIVIVIVFSSLITVWRAYSMTVCSPQMSTP